MFVVVSYASRATLNASTVLDERVFREDDGSDSDEDLRGDFSDPITILQSPAPLSMNSIPSLQT